MKSKIIFLVLLMSVSLKLTAQYGYYFNKELNVGLDINSINYFMQIFNPEMFIQHDKKMIDSLLSRDKEIFNSSTYSDLLYLPMKGTFITGGYSIEKDSIILKDFESHLTIATFIIIDSLTMKLNFSTIKTFFVEINSIYFYKTVSYYEPNPNDFISRIQWKYSNFDVSIEDSCKSHNWYFFDKDQNLIKTIPDRILFHPLSNQKNK
ncbi:MAG: hypothetical protein RBR28_11695 [Lentimicrobium sp.]|nr:hypothetical protein [Lentimicrobium sp.]